MMFKKTASRSNSNKNREIKNCLHEMFLVSLIVSLCMVKAMDALDDGMHDYSRNKEAYKRPHYGDQSHPAKSCAAIFKQLPNLPSGVYWLDVYDAEKNKTIQEKHYCQNTVSNETKTGLKYKGQQKEIGIEDLSLGPPDPEPFDWEELTGENWPLPITPPSKEEMKQRLQKAVKDYKEKMKEKNKETSGSNLIWNLIGSEINAPIVDHKMDRTEADLIRNPVASRFNAFKDEHKVGNTELNVMQNSVNGRASASMNNLEVDRFEPSLIRNSVSNQISNNTTDNDTDHYPQNDVTSHYPKVPDSTGIINYVNYSGVDPNQRPAMTGVATTNAGNSSVGDQYGTKQNVSNGNLASSPLDSFTSNLLVDKKQSKEYNQSGTESKWNSNALPESREVSWRNSTPNLSENYAGLSYTAQSIAKEFLLYRYDSNVSSVPASNKVHSNANGSSATAYGETQSYNNLNWTTNNASSYGIEIPSYSMPDAANSSANRLNSNATSYSQGAVTYGANYSTSYRNESSYQGPISAIPVLQTYNVTSALPYYQLPTTVNGSYDPTSNVSLSISSVADGYKENALNQSAAENDFKLETYNGGNELLSKYSTTLANVTYLGVSSNEVGSTANASSESKNTSMSYYNGAGYKMMANDSTRLSAATTSLPAYSITLQVPHYPTNTVNDSYQGAIGGDNSRAMSTERTGVARLYYNSSDYQPMVNETSELRNHNQSSQSPVFVSTNLNDSYRGDVINGTSYSQVVDTNRDNVTSQAMADNTVEMPSYNLPSYLPYHKVQPRVGSGEDGENKNTLSYAQDFYRENPNPSIEAFVKEATGVLTYNATRQPPSYSQPTTVDSGYHGVSYNATSYSQPTTVDNGNNGVSYNATSYSQPTTVNNHHNAVSYNATSYSQPTTVNNDHNGVSYNATSYSQPTTVNNHHNAVSYNATSYSQPTTVNNDHNGVSYNATTYSQRTTVDGAYHGVNYNATSYSQPTTVDNSYNGVSYDATSYLQPTMLNNSYSEDSYNTMTNTDSTGKQQQNTSNALYYGYFNQTMANASAEVRGYNVTANLPSYYQSPIVNDSKAEPNNNDSSRIRGTDEAIYYGYTVNGTSMLPLYDKGNSVSSTVDLQAVNKQQNPGLYNDKDGYETTANSNQMMPNYNYSSTSLPFNLMVDYPRETATEGSSRVDLRNVTNNVDNTSVSYRNDGVSGLSLNQIANLPANSSLQLKSNMVTQASKVVKTYQIENINSSISNDIKSYPAKASNEMVNASSRYDIAAFNSSADFLTIGNKAKENDRNIATPIKTIASTKYASIVPSSTNIPVKTVGTTRNNVNKPDDGQRSVKMMLLKLRQVVASPKLKGSMTEISSKLEKGLSNKYLQREGLFVKPGLNRGVIETIVTKDTVNVSKPKNAHAITREIIISNSSKASSSQSQRPNLLEASRLTSEKLGQSPSSPDRLDSETNKARAQLIKLWHKTDEYPTDSSTTSFARQSLGLSQSNPAVDPDSLLFTGEALKLKVPERDPQRTPNPDELHKGLWTGEAMNYTAKAQNDFAEQQKYAQEHGGLKTINDRIDEHNKQRESTEESKASHDPKNAEDTRDKMKDFYNRNDEITSQYRNPYYSTSGRESQKSVAGKKIFHDNEEGIKGMHQSGKTERLRPKKISGSSSRIGLGSSAGSSSTSESSSSSSSETYSETGVNSESGTTTESTAETEPSENDVPSFDQDTAVDDSDQVWNPDEDYFVDLDQEENRYNDYETPLGLGIYADTNIEAGVDTGANAESQVGSDAQSESEMGFNAGPQPKFPGYGFGNGFGMGLGMNVGSQSGSESMTETSVSVGTSTDSKTESESKTGSNSRTNPGSKSKYKYRWKKGPSTSEKLIPISMAVFGLHPVLKTGPVEEPLNSEMGLFKGLPYMLESRLETLAHHNGPKMVSKENAKAKASQQLGTGSIGNYDTLRLNLKDHSRFKAAPQLGIQVGSDAQTQASTSASTQSQSGSNAGSRPLKPRLRLQSHINLEKHRKRLGNRMKSHKDRLDYDTQTNPLRMMKMREKSPTLMKLEAVAEKTRNKPRGSHGPKANKHHGSNQGNQNTNTGTDPNKVEATVNIQYQGTNTKGVDISANINTVNGQQVKKPNKNKSNNDNDDNIGRYGTGSPYGWYVRDSGHVPSTAELNMKLNSIPYAKYVPQMRKAAGRRRM